MPRKATIERKTKETEITLTLNLDGKGQTDIHTGIPFLDHMFTLTGAHGYMDLIVSAKGDLEVDFHHTVEDLGICLGQAINRALGERQGISRYGQAIIPMDEALARVIIDVSNRPFLAYRVTLDQSHAGSFDVALIREFFRALVNAAGMTMHIDLLYGSDPHHSSESIFKAFARALDQAVALDRRRKGEIPSTKGLL